METLQDPQSAPDLLIEKEPKPSSKDRVSLLGYLLLIVSVGLYGLEEYYEVGRGDDNFTIFFVHYFLALAFVGILIANKSYGIRKSWRKEHLQKTIILLNLFLVSAYALNRVLPVFEESVQWLCAYLVMTSFVLLSYAFFNRLPKAINYLQHTFLGSALVLYLYMTIYVANFYMLGTIGVILLGVGAHIFVPVLLLAATLRLLGLLKKENRVSLAWVGCGAAITIGIVVAFMIVWNSRVKQINRLANQSVLHADTDLPVWVKVAQTIKNDWINERILKSRLIYTMANDHFNWAFFPTDMSWDEKRKHDPLVFLATANGISSLSADDRKSILRALTDSRHKAQERLWAGDNLSTSYIVSDVDLYPSLRIAYTEHYLNVRNNNTNNGWWGNSQEAIYTFQLPEGSVVTSLSLWINGKEEKAILTSKQKANNAYTTIVGREMRDPSVVHWQEGNTVSVRVFPCTRDEERKFKIGITSPMAIIGNKVVYQNITFRGPNASEAVQASRVRVIGDSENITMPGRFTKNLKGEFVNEGAYDEELSISMDVATVKPSQFSFDGFSYSLLDVALRKEKVDFKEVYLDINNSWTECELESLQPMLKDYKVFAYYDNEFLPVTAENWKEVTTTLQEANFSLFPFHHIKDTDHAIVITKGKELSPHLADFKKSAFAEGIGQYFASGKKVYVFNIEGSSTYIKSLKELRAFHYAQGKISELFQILDSKDFPMADESSERVVLHDSNLVITKKVKGGESGENTAPDHLARLFAYNDIMRQVGVNFFKEDFINEKLVDEAATAYVVSPVSSLIVLETKEDYERFGIKDKENSLHNASKNSSGAVPEPHEWALIVMFIGYVGFHLLRSRSRML